MESPNRLRRSPQLTVTIAIAAGVFLLLGSVMFGMRWPNAWGRSGPKDATQFDYSALNRSLGRLSDEYLRSALGLTGTLAGRSDGRAAGTRKDRLAGLSLTHPFTNDDFERAYEVTSLPFRARTDTTGAKRQPGEPTDCFPAGGTAWYRYRALTDVALFADTFGTPSPTSLGVYTGNSLAALKPIGCDTNVLGNAQSGFRAAAGVTYYFQVTASKGGPTVFGLAAVGPTTIETLSPSGGRPDKHASSLLTHPEISGDGRWVVFISYARNLTSTPPNCGGAESCHSFYLRDRVTGRTDLIASSAEGTPHPANPGDNGPMFSFPAMTPNARYVGFGFHPPLPGWPGFQDHPDATPKAANAYVLDRTTGQFELVSRNSQGEAAKAQPGSDGPSTALRGSAATGTGGNALSISADGRYVIFTSDGANMGGHVEPGRAWNVYRRDRVTGTTRLVSVDSSGEPMHANSFACTGRNLSGDGRHVFFRSTSQTGGDNPNVTHLYLWDAQTGRTRLVTKLPDGVQTLGNFCPSISSDGSRTAFVSRDALVAEDTNGTPDVYAYEVASGRFRRVSVTSAGEQTTDANFGSYESFAVLPRSATLSADGRYVAFDSSAPDLVPGSVGSTRYAGPGSPGPIQVYVHDLVTGATILASVSSIGEPLAGNSILPYISPDGGSVAFMNSGFWTNQNDWTKLDILVHQLR